MPKCVVSLVHTTSTALYDVVYASIEIVSCVRKANGGPVVDKKSKVRGPTVPGVGARGRRVVGSVDALVRCPDGVVLFFSFQGRASTDARIVPNLIFAIESYDRYVIQVSGTLSGAVAACRWGLNGTWVDVLWRRCPNVSLCPPHPSIHQCQLSKKSSADLTRYMKGSKARDFRVTIADVTRALAEVDEDEENDSGQPSCKKAKVGAPWRSSICVRAGHWVGESHGLTRLDWHL